MRVSTRPALERILVIDMEVRQRKWPNARTLSRELEVVRRTIQRDIEFMRDQLHAPLEFDSVRNGYYYTDPSYRLSHFQVTEGELVALLVSAHVMDEYRGTPPWNRSRRTRRWNHEIHETHERILKDLLPELEDPRAPRWPGPRADVSKLTASSHIYVYYIATFRVFRVFRGSLPSGNSVVAFMNTYLVAYDISNPKRLRKVASTCEDFGLRRQFSVFVCRLTATDLVRLKSRLYEIIDLDMDQVIFVPLCARCSEQIEALGRPTEPPDARDVVIVS